MKKILSIAFFLLGMAIVANAQMPGVDIRRADGGTIVRRSSDNMVANFDPTLASAPLRLNDLCFDRRRGALYRWNGVSWQIFFGRDDGQQADVAYTVTNPASNILTGWDPQLYNKATVNYSTAGVDTFYVDTLIFTGVVTPGEIFVVDFNTTTRTTDADTVLIHFNSMWKTYDGQPLPEWKCPPRGRIHMAFRVHVSVEGATLVEVDDILGSYGHGGGGGGGGNGIDTITGGYPTLRATLGSTLSDMVYVNNWTYTYRSVSYSSVGGLFVKASIGLGENGGTVIVAADGTRWQRIFDGVTFLPDWWEVGGKNVAGQPVAYVATDCMRIDACSRTAGQGATILFSEHTYTDCDQSISSQQSQRWVGQNCKTILRAKNAQLTRLTANAIVGATSISVTDTTGFRIGQTLLLRKQRGYSLTLHSAVTITSKAAGTISFSPALTNAFATNDTVVVVNRLLTASGTSAMKSLPITFEGIEFDCNWRSRRFVNSWAQNEVIEASSFNIYFTNCNFVNTPAENVFFGKGAFTDCRFGAACTNSPATEKRMAGSIGHGSNTFTTEVHPITYRYCTSDSTNQVAASVLGHGSSLFSFSSNNFHVEFVGGSFRNGGGWIYGSDNNDGQFSATGGEFENFTAIGRFAAATGGSTPIGDIRISGGRYVNCGDLMVYTVDAARQRNVRFENMSVVNGRLYISGSNQIEVINNTFYERRSNPAVSPFSTDLGAPLVQTTRSMFWVQTSSNINITGNTFAVDSIYNANCMYGIHFTATGMSTINSGADYFQQNVNVSNNVLRNFRYGIGNQFGGYNTPELVRRVGWSYRNNEVTTLFQTSLDGYGIQVGPGVVASDNVIYMVNPNNQTFGLVVSGVDDSGINETRVHGGEAYNNSIHGRNASSILVGSGIAGINEHNATCERNRIMGTITDNTAGQSLCQFNTVMNSTLLPTLTSYLTPVILNNR